MARLHKNIHESMDDEALRKLRSANVITVVDFLQHDDDKLEGILKIDRQEVEAMKEQFFENFGGKIQSGRELLRLEENNIVSTGISSLDELLDGGLHPGELYELCGLSSAGKTQLCHSLAVNVVLETNGIVRYIDTKKDFSGARIQTMLEVKNRSDEETAQVMSQIRVTRATSIHELLSVLYDLARTSPSTSENAGGTSSPTKLLIIDSLPSLILASSNHTDAHRSLHHIAGLLKFLADNFCAPVITCNLVTKWRDVDGFVTSLLDKPVVVKPNLGKFWLQVPNTRLHVEKMTNDETRKISVWKSFRSRLGDSCLVELNDAGFT